MTRTALIAAFLMTLATAASAQGFVTSFPNLTYPTDPAPVTQGCSDLTSAATCATGN